MVGLLFAAHSRGELLEPGFEPQAGTYEHTVWLSRYSGGNAEGGRQSAADGAKVRSGKHAFRLAIHPEKGKRVRSWAVIYQTHPVEAGQRVTAGAWFFTDIQSANASEFPVVAQARIEFFTDAEASQQVFNQAPLSAPFTVGSHEANRWHEITARGRAPAGAHFARIAISLVGGANEAYDVAVWADDVYVEVEGEARSKSRSNTVEDGGVAGLR